MMLSDLSNRCGGQLIGADLGFDSVSTDSRTLRQGDVYVALSGERFDGHNFLSELEDKAAAFVLERPFKAEKSQVLVNDTRRALGEIAAYCREQFEGPVIAITGSSGKTTARNMLAAVMRLKGEVCTTRANHNNEIGVPLTLLGLKNTDVAAVVELGARHLGDISYLGQFVKPTISILLNAGTAHIGEFGGYENIVEGKGEIYQVLSDDGVAIVNLDDPAHRTWEEQLGSKRVLTYSVDELQADIKALDIELKAHSSTFTLVTPKDRSEVALSVGGRHNISNALAAAGAAYALGMTATQIAEGLSHFEGEKGRQSRMRLSENLLLIDDSYNANPASMNAALDVLAMEQGSRIAILGEMGELGDDSERLHLDVAEHAAKTDIEAVWLIGTYAIQMAERIGVRARAFDNKNALANALKDHESAPTTVLIKGSRFMALEELIEIYKRGQI